MSDSPIDLEPTRRWRIGDVTISRVLEMDTLTLDPAWLLQGTPGDVVKHPWLQPEFATADGQIKANIQAFIIEAGGKRIMVDPCIGNHKPRESALFNMLNNPFLERLEAAGFARERIDVVLCTHLHVDHCGWNTMLVDGEWVPTFPNARYLFAKVEFEYTRADEDATQRATYNDSIRPIFEAGLADLIDTDHQIVAEVRLVPTPGHTPGHCCVLISSQGQEAVITGDMMHHPLQACEPDMCSNYCWDEEQAKASRKALLARASKEGTIVIGTHFSGPTAVHVLVDGEAWRMEGA